ncbi:3-dehydroquinate synthase [Roseivirga sp. E12]|uniref:3-dehydroquinate synthase n=1 Tax=Roseivirga sp. E12 TaxID=2819237 RepID=UPI001ABC621D|nr:3-dehydroquinate synthase [Roseivirga sp. E12]MBO3700050.1 3-dehydroquinate synthase [Roseivirga sp. E12]
MSQITIDDIQVSLKQFFDTSSHSKVAVLVDEKTREFCYPVIQGLLPEHLVIEITSGEINKTLDTCQIIWQALTNASFDRKSLLVNLGGGVIGDMGGFCAVTYKRGIDFINIPTTLLAAVDANVGGKLGIDFQGFKNHIGFFKDPNAVLIDPIFLETLPDKELRSGFAEVIKHGLITDKDYYEKVAKVGLDQDNWHAVIAHSVEIKNQVVKQDPREAGLRKILNFGHTIGHAIESHYLDTDNHLLHGEAIAIGMICEAYVSKKLLSLQEIDLKEICETILNIYPDINIHKKDFTAIIKLMYQDKKNVNNFLNHSLIYEIGRAGYDVAVDEKDVMDALFFYLTLKQ